MIAAVKLDVSRKNVYLSGMYSETQQRIRRLLAVIMLAFLVLLVWQSYWHLCKSDWLFVQQGNRRLDRLERMTQRGSIFDRTGAKLAWSEQGVRHYADAPVTAGVLGYNDPVYKGTRVEGEWNLELSGISRRFSPTDLQRILANEPPRGNDLLLTLDLRLQQAACAALGERKGAVVLLDPSSGGILALATYPTFNPDTLREDFKDLTADTEGKLRNRALQDVYPPGSTMKLVTASAALMHGVDPATRYTCTGKTRAFGVTITDFHGEAHGSIDMTTALAKSCNNYFAHTAANLSQDAFFTTAENFGFGQRWWLTKLPDPHILPMSIAKSSLAPDMTKTISQGERAHMGFGQSTVVATPLQMAMVSAAIANDGKLMAPYLVSSVRKGGTTRALATFSSQPIGYPLDSETAGKVAAMMRQVVLRGTAVGANVDGLTVYGKTGTAQQEGGDDHAWFIGFAECQRPTGPQRVAFAVLIERGGTGGRVAVPVARKILECWRDDGE